MNADAKASCAAQMRSASYRLLSRMFLEEVPLAFLKALPEVVHAGFSGMSALPCDLDRTLADAVERVGARQVFLDAAADCAALLWGMSARSVHPYESVYASPAGVMMQEPRDQVVSVYRRAGVAISEGGANIPEDHIGIELAFMALLCERQARALVAADDDLVCEACAMQHSFLRDHLLNWAPTFCEDLFDRAEKRAQLDVSDRRGGTPLYASLAQVTQQFLKDEMRASGGRLTPPM